MPARALLVASMLACHAATPVDTDTGTPCVPEVATFVDWMAPGPHGAGHLLHSATTDLRGTTMPFEVQVTYPAVDDGDEVAVADGGPFPVVFFEHAYGADYLNSDWLLDRLASRGFVVYSAAHNGAWDGAGDWWNDHASLFLDTVAWAHANDVDATSLLAGAHDFERAALMGHSHGGGAALHVMDQVDVDAVVLITTRPSLDANYARYHEVYDGMPPMLNVVASRDEDSTTAYGTSIAVYEALTRPRFMVTVEGASHYTFTDERGIGASSITREAGQVAGGSAVVAFLEAMLHDDPRGVHSLTGDVALAGDDAAPYRRQSHLDGARVIDDFETTTSAPGTAIAGIPDQTFVNGFMGDTFVDFEAGVDLLVAQIEALSGPGDRVLFYQDASRGTDAYAAALRRVDRDVTTLSSDVELAAALPGSWDLVVATQQDGGTADAHPFDDALAAWICGGGKAILSDFRHRSTTAAVTLACAGVRFDGATNWTRMTSQGDLFDGELRVHNPGWGVFTVGLGTSRTAFAANDLVTEGLPDPNQGPLGAVQATGLQTFTEVSAFDPGRRLTMPTRALELAWDAPAEVRWELGQIDGTGDVVSLRLLQVHDDPWNVGSVTASVRLTDAAGHSAALPIAASPTPTWLETTVPKSVFETVRLPIADFGGVDASRLVALSLVFDGSARGRLLVDDLELSPGLGCAAD